MLSDHHNSSLAEFSALSAEENLLLDSHRNFKNEIIRGSNDTRCTQTL